MRYSIFGVFAAAMLGAAISTADVRPAVADSARVNRVARQIQTGEVASDYARDRRYRGSRFRSSSRYYGRRYYGRPYAHRYYRRAGEDLLPVSLAVSPRAPSSAVP